MSTATRLKALEMAGRSLAATGQKQLRIKHLMDKPTTLFPWCGLEPDEWMTELLTELATTDYRNRKTVICAGRQVGKSTFSSLYIAHALLAGRRVALTAPAFRQSAELALKVKTYLHRLNLLHPLKEAVTDTQYANGARLVLLPGDAGNTSRGFSISLLVIDEAGFLSPGSDVLTAMAPALALSAGEILLASSPGSNSGILADAWKAPSGWRKVKVRSRECKRIPATFLDEQLALLGPELFAREFEGEFIDLAGQLIPTSAVDEMFSLDSGVCRWVNI